MPAVRVETGELDRFGAFFTVATHHAPPSGRWRPLAELVGDPAVLRRRVRAVREALAGGAPRAGRAEEVELRVAASTAHLGLVARLLAPAVAVAAISPRRLDLSLTGLFWQDRLGEPFPLSVPALATDAPLQVGRTAVDEITEAVGREFAVSARVLWGNVGSAANTAAGLVARARPDLAGAALAAADAVLADPRVDGGTLHAGPRFRRRSCCLIYRTAGGRSAVCSDCVLLHHG